MSRGDRRGSRDLFRLARFFMRSADEGTLMGAAIDPLGMGDGALDCIADGGAEEVDGIGGADADMRVPLSVARWIASVAVIISDSSNSLHFVAPGQEPSQLSKNPIQLFASSIAVRDAPTSIVCIAYSKMMTAELNSV